MEKDRVIMELTAEELVVFLNCLREGVTVNITVEEEGGDPDDRREEI